MTKETMKHLILDTLMDIQNDISTVYEEPTARFSEDLFLEKLQEVKAIFDSSLRIERSKNLPEGVLWCSAPYAPDRAFDPYAFDGSMTPKDHEKRLELFQKDQLLEQKSEEN